jgi:hypothetical protein
MQHDACADAEIDIVLGPHSLLALPSLIFDGFDEAYSVPLFISERVKVLHDLGYSLIEAISMCYSGDQSGHHYLVL